MDRKTKRIAGGVLALAVVVGGAGVAFATIADDDPPLSGATLDQATTAALRYTGGGTVIDTETGDDGAVYEVAVRLDDGSVVEVELDASFKVIGQENEEEKDDDIDGEG